LGSSPGDTTAADLSERSPLEKSSLVAPLEKISAASGLVKSNSVKSDWPDSGLQNSGLQGSDLADSAAVSSDPAGWDSEFPVMPMGSSASHLPWELNSGF
jgi:hypothetical protein